MVHPGGELAATADSGRDAEFDCPRCGRRVHECFYGPCTSCRRELRATLGGGTRDVEVAEYEPKMNVTPNAVALRDD